MHAEMMLMTTMLSGSEALVVFQGIGDHTYDDQFRRR